MPNEYQLLPIMPYKSHSYHLYLMSLNSYHLPGMPHKFQLFPIIPKNSKPFPILRLVSQLLKKNDFLSIIETM